MILHIPNLLSLDELNHCRQTLNQAEWVDGKMTTGHQSAYLKNNLQLAQDSQDALQLGQIIQQAANSNPLFFSASLPKTFLPPLFNCYQHSGSFGMHVDNAIRRHPLLNSYLRTDVSCTVFLSNPEEYTGGELVIEDTFGTQEVKLPAGDAIVYPSTSLHMVNPVTEGARFASFFWVQSFIASNAQRRILFELDQNIQKLTVELSATHEQVISLTGIYHNLLREWSDL